MAQEWMNDPTLAGIDPAKMALLNSLVQQGSKKNQNEMLAFLMSAAANSKRNGLQFSPGEMDMIAKALKKGKSPQETAKMDRMLSMMKMLRRGKKSNAIGSIPKERIYVFANEIHISFLPAFISLRYVIPAWKEHCGSATDR